LFVDGESGFDLETQNIEVPPSLMLHSASQPLMADFLSVLKKNNIGTITYENLLSKYVLGKKETTKGEILLSLDDFGTDWTSPSHKRIIEVISDEGMVGTLGVVTNSGDSGNWGYLKELSTKGWEIAIHTVHHCLLPQLTDKQLKEEIEVSYKLIERNIGKPPVSIILPFGIIERKDGETEGENGFDNRIFEICKDLGIWWIVGIKDGKNISGKPPYYVGRIPPSSDHDANTTLNLLNGSFMKGEPTVTRP